MGARVSRNGQLFSRRQLYCVHQRGGGFQEGQAIVEEIRFSADEPSPAELTDTGHRKGSRLERSIGETNHQGLLGMAIMAIIVTPRDVCAVEQTALESTILHQRAMKEPTPRGIGKITIHGDAGVRRERAADVVPLHQSLACQEVGEGIAHTFGKGRGPAERTDLYGHIVPEMHLLIPLQQPLQDALVAQMERIK